MRIKIFEMIPSSSQLALRQSCKQLKSEVDNLVGLKMFLSMKDLSEEKFRTLALIEPILLRKLTIRRESFENLQKHSGWKFFLMNAGYANLNQLSLYNLKIQDDAQLSSILFAVSSINSLREFSLSLTVKQISSISLKSGVIGNNYDFSKLTSFNLRYEHRERKSFNFIEPNKNRTCSYLKSFKQMRCPQLEKLQVSLDTQFLEHQTEYLLWYLELLEKFAGTINCLRISIVYRPSSYNKTIGMHASTINEKALKIGSEFRNLKELDVDLFGGLIPDSEDERRGPVKGWMNLLCGMRTGLEKLKLLFCQGSQTVCNRYQLLTKNSYPNLKELCLVWNHSQLDWKMMTHISDQLETLKLQSRGGGFTKKVKNFDQIPLSLKKITLWDFASSVEDWDFLIKLISTKKSLTVEYDFLINLKMAEYLGDCLSWPNFIWRGIEFGDQDELKVAALCLAFDIPLNKLYRVESSS